MFFLFSSFFFFWESWFLGVFSAPFLEEEILDCLAHYPFTGALAVARLYEDSIGGGFPEVVYRDRLWATRRYITIIAFFDWKNAYCRRI